MRYLKCILIAFLMLGALQYAALADTGATVITTAEQLSQMERNGNYVLGNDIALTGQWTPIYFEGTLDGNGHTITGLRINCSGETNVGLFSWLKGTVSNLTIENASVTAYNTNGCNASIIGTCEDAWNFDPDSTTAHVFNCHVSGTVKVSGKGVLGGSALIGAEDSTANVNIFVEGSDFMSPGLWGCRDCELTGRATVTDLGGGYGDISAIMNSSGCDANFYITVLCDDPDASDVETYGINAREGVRSSYCVYSGEISSAAHACAIRRGDVCESNATIISDNAVGMNSCVSCVTLGEIRNAGKKIQAKASFMLDSDSFDDASNESDTNYSFTSSGATKEITFSNHLKPGDVIWGDICIDAGTTVVNISEHFEKPENYEKHVYNHGNLDITTTSGFVSVFRNTATTGRVRCISDTGMMDITAGAYNSGDIYACSSENIHAVGATIYNRGTVSIECYGGGTAIGAYGEGALNAGYVFATGDSDMTIGAVGAGGTGSTNHGSVSADNGGIGEASATGVSGENCLNTGFVSAGSSDIYYPNAADGSDNKREVFANACGASGSGSFNSGTVSASGSCYCVHAFGASDGASSTGTVNARGSYIANADGDGGTAMANGGEYASASGIDPSASGGGCSVSGGTLYAWKLESHHNACLLSHDNVIITSTNTRPSFECESVKDGKVYVCGRTNYNLRANTTLTEFSGGQNPGAAEAAMPEEDEPNKPGRVEIILAGEKSEDYAISQFTYAWGSFAFPVEADANGVIDHTAMYAKVTVFNETNEAKAFKLNLNLPDGFSEQPWSVDTAIDISCEVSAGSKHTSEWIAIYPLYREQCPGSVKFNVTGDLKKTHSVSVSRLKSEGIALCRPTGSVNPNDNVAIPVELKMDCIKDMVENSTSEYNDNVALLTCALSQAIYQESYIQDTMENLGFTCYKFEESSGSHDVASAYAVKKVVSDGEVYPVILATVRGTVGLEWIGNFNVGFGEDMHADFWNCAQKTLTRFEDYCKMVGFPKEHSRAIFSAHSRAAAATNLLAAELNDSGACVEDLVAYCYATPNTTQNPKSYKNIFNIVYIDDLVAYVPQGYYKNGVSFFVGEIDADAPDTVEDYFLKYCSRSYMNPRNTKAINFTILTGKGVNSTITVVQDIAGRLLAEMVGDSSVAQAHGAENYLAWIQGNGIHNGKAYGQVLLMREQAVERLSMLVRTALQGSRLRPFYEWLVYQNVYHDGTAGSIMAGVFCPVDVTVRDSDGNIVVQAENHEIVSAADSCLLAAVVDEHHLFGLNIGEGYTFEITGNGSGTMSIEMVTVDENVVRTDYVSFVDIPVSQGETYKLKAFSDVGSDSWKIVSGSGTEYYPDTTSADIVRMYLPENLTVLKDEAFLNVSAMSGMLVCPDGMIEIGARAFSGSGFKAVLVPDSVTEISDDAFEGTDAVIHCYEGSNIHSFAVEHGINFELIQ